MIVQNSNSQVWGSGMYSIFQNLNLVINRRVAKTVLYSESAPPPNFLVEESKIL